MSYALVPTLLSRAVVIAAAIATVGPAATAVAAPKLAPKTPARFYKCEAAPKNLAIPPRMTPPPDMAADVARISSRWTYPQLCATGQVAVSTTGDAPKAPPPGTELSQAAIDTYTRRFGAKATRALQHSVTQANARAAAAKATKSGTGKAGKPTAHAAMQNNFGAWYGYAVGSQTVPWTDGTSSWYSVQTPAAPWVDHADVGSHSLAQIWGIDNTPGPTAYSDVEVGWNVDASLYPGDYSPHLFVFSFDRGIPGCYNNGAACNGTRGDFVPASSTIVAGMYVPGGEHQFGAQYSGGNWWVNYDGQWVGYYPTYAYPSYANTGFLRLDAGGEVSASNSASCTDMGTGAFGSSGNATYFKQTWRGYIGGSAWGSFSQNDSDPSAWNSSFYNYNGPMGSFLFGGPGYPGCGA